MDLSGLEHDLNRISRERSPSRVSPTRQPSRIRPLSYRSPSRRLGTDATTGSGGSPQRRTMAQRSERRRSPVQVNRLRNNRNVQRWPENPPMMEREQPAAASTTQAGLQEPIIRPMSDVDPISEPFTLIPDFPIPDFSSVAAQQHTAQQHRVGLRAVSEGSSERLRALTVAREDAARLSTPVQTPAMQTFAQWRETTVEPAPPQTTVEPATAPAAIEQRVGAAGVGERPEYGPEYDFEAAGVLIAGSWPEYAARQRPARVSNDSLPPLQADPTQQQQDAGAAWSAPYSGQYIANMIAAQGEAAAAQGEGDLTGQSTQRFSSLFDALMADNDLLGASSMALPAAEEMLSHGHVQQRVEMQQITASEAAERQREMMQRLNHLLPAAEQLSESALLEGIRAFTGMIQTGAAADEAAELSEGERAQQQAADAPALSSAVSRRDPFLSSPDPSAVLEALSRLPPNHPLLTQTGQPTHSSATIMVEMHENGPPTLTWQQTPELAGGGFDSDQLIELLSPMVLESLNNMDLPKIASQAAIDALPIQEITATLIAAEHPACAICLADFSVDSGEVQTRLPEAMVPQLVVDDEVACGLGVAPQEDQIQPETRPDHAWLGSLTQVVAMPCKHLFHKSCLVPWLKQRNTCPTCRFELEGRSSSQMVVVEVLSAQHLLQGPPPGAGGFPGGGAPASAAHNIEEVD